MIQNICYKVGLPISPVKHQLRYGPQSRVLLDLVSFKVNPLFFTVAPDVLMSLFVRSTPGGPVARFLLHLEKRIDVIAKRPPTFVSGL